MDYSVGFPPSSKYGGEEACFIFRRDQVQPNSDSAPFRCSNTETDSESPPSRVKTLLKAPVFLPFGRDVPTVTLVQTTMLARCRAGLLWKLTCVGRVFCRATLPDVLLDFICSTAIGCWIELLGCLLICTWVVARLALVML